MPSPDPPSNTIDAQTVAAVTAAAARIINGGAQHLRARHPAMKARFKKVRAPSP